MIKLREARHEDLPLMMAWRNLTYEGFYTQNAPLTWEEHVNWFVNRPSSWRCFIILYEERPVGVVTIGQLEYWTPEIGYYIGEITLWGKGIGKESVKLAMEYLKSQGKEYCHTTVKEDNLRSLNLLKSLGFAIMGEARDGELWLHRKL